MWIFEVPIETAYHAFIILQGRNKCFLYNYLYTKKELEPWVKKVEEIKKQTNTLRIYFNNHYGGKAVLNALQFKEMAVALNDKEKEALARIEAYLTGKTGLQQWLK